MSKPSSDERVPLRRVLPWALLALLLVAGVYLYFRFGTTVTPLTGTVQ